MSIGRNSLISVGGSVASLAIFTALTPSYIATIGTERFGIVASLLAVTMLLSAANFGMGPALTYHVRSRAMNDSSQQVRLLWGAYTVSLTMAIAAIALLWAVFMLFGTAALRIPANLSAEFRGAFLPLGAIVLFGVLAGNSTALLGARERFTWIAGVQTLDALMAVTLPMLCALLIDPSVPSLILALLLGRAITFLTGLSLAWGRLLGFAAPRTDRATIRSLVGYGSWSAANSTVELVISAADRIVLGVVRGAAAVTFYAVPLSIVVRSMMGPLSLLNAANPQIISRTGPERTALVTQLTRALVMLIPGYAAVALLAHPFLSLWMSPSFANQAAPALAVLAAVFWLEAHSALQMFVINAHGQPRRNFVIALAVLPIYFVALFAFAKWGAATGVAMAFAVRSLVYYVGRIRTARTPATDLRWVSASIALLAAAATVGFAATLLTPRIYITAAAIVFSATLALALLAIPDSVRRVLAGRLPRALTRRFA